jgi:hypothetical protein
MYFVWEHLYPVWHDCGSPIVCMCAMIILVIFTFGIELHYFSIRIFEHSRLSKAMYCTDWPISSILAISPIPVANVNYYYYELQMDLYLVAMCYSGRQENAITHITQNNIQGNPLYAKLQKKSRKHVKTQE